MPINLPNLDDRRYSDLVEEARNLIPTYAPDWTNHNPSDPGITLIELFAYYTEMLLYRLNRITDANKRMFLKLLKGASNWTEADSNLSGEELELAIRKTVLEFRKVDRAVTVSDFEQLALDSYPSGTLSNIERVRCVPRKNMTSMNLLERNRQSPGHISIIIVPKPMFSSIGILAEEIFTDHTVEAGNGNGLGFRLINRSDEYLFIGNEIPFGEIQFVFSQTGNNYQLSLEYYNGSAWVKLQIDPNGLSDFTAGWNVNGSICFNVPPDWQPTVINTINMHWVRISTQKKPTTVATAVRIFPKILQPNAALFSQVANYIDSRRLLTTVVHVVGPLYIRIYIRLTVVVKPDALTSVVRSRIIEALWKFFNPYFGGKDGNGWPFGRSVYVSEVYSLLDLVPGVDFVCRSTGSGSTELDEIVMIGGDDSRIQRNDLGELECVSLYENELVEITFPSGNFLEVKTFKEFQEGASS